MFHFLEIKKGFKKLKETGDKKYIYRNGLNRACFRNDIDYSRYKDLSKRTQSDKVLKDKGFEGTSNPKYDYQAIQRFISFLKKIRKEVLLKLKFNKINNLGMTL